MSRLSREATRTRQRPALSGWRPGVLAVAALAAVTAGCASTGVPSGERRPDAGGPSSLQSLGIPPNAVPPAGRCRIWRPLSHWTRQLSPGSCRRLSDRVDAGGWLLKHPEPAEGEPHRIRLLVFGEDGPAMVRVFDQKSGRLVGKGRPGEVRYFDEGDRAGDVLADRADGGAGDRGPQAPLEDAETLYSLGIPKGAVPPGRCRVWDPALPAGEQGTPGRCDRLRDRVEDGEWLLHHRPAGSVEGDSGRLVVAAYRDGHVVRIQVFNVATGTLVEERTPG